MNGQSDKKAGTFRLFQPELLSDGELIDILKSLCVISDLRYLSRRQLIEVFKKVALPKPQRQYPNTWRGKLLSSRRLKYEKKNAQKRKISMGSGDSNGVGSSNYHILQKDVLKSSSRIKESCLSSERHKSPVKDRLKPPIDLINYKRKTIKLNSSSSSSDLGGIVINDRTRSDSSSVNRKCDLDKIVIKDRRKEKNENTEAVSSHEDKQSSLKSSVKASNTNDQKKSDISTLMVTREKPQKKAPESELDKIIIKHKIKCKKEDVLLQKHEEEKYNREKEVKSDNTAIESSFSEKQRKIKLKRTPFVDQISLEKEEKNVKPPLKKHKN